MCRSQSQALSGEHPQEIEWREDLNVIQMCPDCREMPPNLVDEWSSGDTVCASCGRVLAERIIDMRPEWRTFQNDDGKQDSDPSRVGQAANPLFCGSQLSTEIAGGSSFGSRGRTLQNVHRAANHDPVNERLWEAYNQISTLCDAASIPRTATDTAKMIYRKNFSLFEGQIDEHDCSCLYLPLLPLPRRHALYT